MKFPHGKGRKNYVFIQNEVFISMTDFQVDIGHGNKYSKFARKLAREGNEKAQARSLEFLISHFKLVYDA